MLITTESTEKFHHYTNNIQAIFDDYQNFIPLCTNENIYNHTNFIIKILKYENLYIKVKIKNSEIYNIIIESYNLEKKNLLLIDEIDLNSHSSEYISFNILCGKYTNYYHISLTRYNIFNFKNYLNS